VSKPGIIWGRMRCRDIESLLRAVPLLLVGLAIPLYSHAQKPVSGQKPGQAGQTIHVNVGLVQTDVMVFDRQGHFVPDLKLDQFELRVDGKVQPISFLELISTGTPKDEETWAKAEGTKVASPRPAASGSSDRGRTLLFFLDDWHLSADSVIRSRAALSDLIDTTMGANDRAAIFSATGQLGFLQQLSDNKAVLHAAVARLSFTNGAIQDLERPVMNEAQAAAIEQGNTDVFGYFVAATLQENPGLGRMAQSIVRARADSLAQKSAEITRRSLAALANVLTPLLPCRGASWFIFCPTVSSFNLRKPMSFTPSGK
jgi:VWFA-related protein